MVSRYSRPLGGVEVLAMLDGELHITQRVEFVYEVPPGPCVLPFLVPGMVVGVFVDRHCRADRVEVTH